MRSKSSVSTTQAERTSNEKVDELVKKSFTNATQMMAKAGYKIPDNVKVTVDPQLPFMGYTMPTRQGFNIVVAGGAVGSGMLEGLLVHEMSHIYRIATNHPSHNGEILEEAVQHVAGTSSLADYQQKIIHDLLNDIQDLYADDLALRVFRTTPTPVLDQMTEFFQSWVKSEPIRSGTKNRDSWENASIMTHNARAIAQMERHHIEDTDNRATKASETFLKQVSPSIAKEFDYFRNTLLNLKENMTENEYKTLLADYLDRFLRITK
ncbi:hypothetical protein J2P12_02655 [Candidatus Bathyarchaeota archaeon]|nr:hypothetical protein [Candidatus Bathyarchaeota archaeon]